MYMRLWWKDARQFWPIWVFLALAAAVTQGLVLNYAGPDARHGALGVLAWGWTCLYAFVVGAAAFAGERETGTLRLLDILPAPRTVVWSGKVSFALGTTLALAGTLLGMAALGTDRWGPQDDAFALRFGVSLGVMVLHALGWGLFFSAILSNALFAAIASICFTGLSSSVLVAVIDEAYFGGQTSQQMMLWHLLGALAPLLASHIAFTWARRSRRSPLQFRFQSPIVVTWSRSPRPRRLQVQLQPHDTPAKPKPMPKPKGPMPELSTVVAATSWTADQPRPRSWFAEARSLAWETIREGRSAWCLFAVIGLIIPVCLFILTQGRIEETPFVIANTLVALAAGVSAFVPENRARTYQFLAYHGVRPGLVWLVKLATWCFGLAVIWVAPAILTADSPVPRGQLHDYQIARFWLPLLGFAVGQLCGMAIPRGITAWVIALVVMLALAIPQFAMVTALLLPDWALLVLPAALLVATWAWSGDWLLDRPAPGRWVRLGLILASTFAVLLGGYAGSRAWGVPDAGPITPPQAWVAAAVPLPPDWNAASLYREAVGRLGNSKPADPEFLSRNRETLALIREAAARPDCRFRHPEQLTLLNSPAPPPMRDLAGLVAAAARNRQQHGDLAGAWSDIVAILRMARHLGEGATLSQVLQALEIEKTALDLAMDWAAAPGQTPERLRAAIAAYRDRPRPIPATDVVRAEALLIERTIALPFDDLKGLLLDSFALNPDHTVGIWTSLWHDVMTTPWERTRAFRVNRTEAAAMAQFVALEPWRRKLSPLSSALGPGGRLSYDAGSTPLLNRLLPYFGAYLEADDGNEVRRRALVQVLAIRAWQLRHDGRFPDRLEALVPEDLSILPDDPYSGRSFEYVLLAADRQAGPAGQPRPPAQTAARLLRSIGPESPGGNGIRNALGFEIPSLGEGPGAVKARERP
jgi:hypothetical protein